MVCSNLLEEIAGVLEDALQGDGGTLPVEAYGAPDDAFSECQVDVAVVHDAICHECIDDSFEVTNTMVHVGRDEVDDVF